MGALNNLYVSSSFQGLLKMTNSATGLTNTLQTIEAGDGSDSPLQMSLTQVNISGSFTVNNNPITGSTSGSSGTSGTSGTSGSSGANGSSGSSGTSGVGFSVKGTWNPSSSYTINDIVLYNGSSYIAIQNSIGQIPSINPTYWVVQSAAGSSGTSGTSGSSGSNGTSGSNGSSGTSGSNGSSGTSGSSGSNGSSGTSGSSGSNGSSGTSGSNGSSGTSGTSGSNGSSGTSGINGTSGTSGSNGSSGTSGSNGSSGTSGSSGSSGTSGQNGISAGRTYYFNQSQNSDIAGYKVLSEVPTTGATQSVVKSLTSNQQNVLVESYMTPQLGFNVIPAGVQRFHLHLLKPASNDDIDVYVTLQLANSTGGTIGPLITSSANIITWNSGNAAEVYVDVVLPTTYIDPSNRMIVKIYLNNNDSTTHSVTYYTEGNEYSYVITSVGVVSGTSGTSGTSGANGSNGTSGTSGIDGTSGTSGSSGTNGSSGTSGSNGSSGTSGSNGSSGTSGSDGSSGTSGTNGSAGTSGTSGSSGQSGLGLPAKSFVKFASDWTYTNYPGTGSVSVLPITFTTPFADTNYSVDFIYQPELNQSSFVNGTGSLVYDWSGQVSPYIQYKTPSGFTISIDNIDITTGSTLYSGFTSFIDCVHTGESNGSGLNGTSGTSGTSGVGTNGTSGSSGTSGSNGSSGTSGSNGSSGTSGGTGSSGTSGTSGSSGDSIFAQTGSFYATTNNLQITGSLNISGSQLYDLVVTGGVRIVNPSNTQFNSLLPSTFNIDTTRDTSVNAENYIFGATGSESSIYVGVYDQSYVDDVELRVAVNKNDGIKFQDWDNVSAGAYVNWLTVAPNLGNNPIPQFTRGLNVTGSLTVNGLPITGSGGGDRNGLITTGSISTTQTITGSLRVTGSISLTGSMVQNVVPVTGALSGTFYTASFNFNDGDIFDVQLLAGSLNTFTFSNIKNGQLSTIYVKTSGSSTVKLPEVTTYVSGGVYTPSTGDTVDILSVYGVGTGSLYVVPSKGLIPIPSTALDPDAAAYISTLQANGATVSTNDQTAIDTLFKSLKSNNLYTKIQAMYPFYGGTAATTKFNAVNPADTNAAFRITWSGGVSYNASGVTFNGTSNGNTNMQSTVHILDFDKHYALYSMNTTNAFGGWDGVWSTGTGNVFGINLGTSNAVGVGLNSGPNSAGGLPAAWKGFYIGNVSGSAANGSKVYKDSGIQYTQTTTINAFNQTINYTIGQLNNNGSLGNGHSRTYAFYSIGKAFTDAQASTYNTIVTTYLTSTGRI